jgi:hypothetical protein
MSRKIRRVPKDWSHPKRENGTYEPLNSDYVGILDYYKKDVEQFINTMTEVIEKGSVKIYDKEFTSENELYEYLTEDGQINTPDINDYMPTGEWYQLYEEVSEGTPLSPPFATKEELINWLTENEDFNGNVRTKEAAEFMVNQGYMPSGIMMGGKFYTPEEQHKISK